MTYKENITAILECYFTGFKEEIIDSACNRILEQEPCEDCISREEVIKLAKCFPMPIDVEDEGYVCISDIKKLPSVTPMRKKGKWIKNSWEICYTCTRCLKTNSSGVKNQFCPNCGADMREVEE